MWSYQGYSKKSAWAYVGASDSWSFVGTDGSGNLNANPNTPNGSISVNDIQIRSVGKMASQVSNRSKTWLGWLGNTSGFYLGSHRECSVSSFQVGGDTQAYFDLWNDGAAGLSNWWISVRSGGSGVKVTCYS